MQPLKSKNNKKIASGNDAIEIIFLSFKQGFKRLAYWIRPNIWTFFLSITVLLAPAAKAGLFTAVAEGLRDPGESRTIPRIGFRKGFFENLGRSILFALLNLLILIFILVSILFWTYQDDLLFNLLSIPGFYFLAYWWLCQPFLFPALIENRNLSILAVYKHVVVLVFPAPLFSFNITLLNTLLTVVGVALLGPILFVIPALLALISTQAYWHLRGDLLPEWEDPVVYQQRLDLQEKDQNTD